MSLGSALEDDAKVLTTLGVTISKLKAYLDVIKCTLQDDDNDTIYEQLKTCCKVASIQVPDPDSRWLTQTAVLIESSLCMHGGDVSCWASTWTKAIRYMQKHSALPQGKDVLPTELGNDLDSADKKMDGPNAEDTPRTMEADVKQEVPCLAFAFEHLSI